MMRKNPDATEARECPACHGSRLNEVARHVRVQGFTIDQVTDLSGRGVGMDIVKQGVISLGGTITLTSTPGRGTRFRIRLPLTIAILEGLSLAVV